MKVTKEHLIGDIADFPIEIVQKMVDYQIKERGVANLPLLARNVVAGFTWCKTPEGSSWWNDIIGHRNFSKFFERYPKKQTNNESIITLRNKNKVLTLKFNL